MVGAKRAFLSVTPPNDFRADSLDKSVNSVQSDMPEAFFVRRQTFFDGMTENTRDYHLWPDQLVLLWSWVAHLLLHVGVPHVMRHLQKLKRYNIANSF